MKLVSYLFLFLIIISFACKTQKVVSSQEEVSSIVKSGEAKNILFISIDDLKPLLSNYGQ